MNTTSQMRDDLAGARDSITSGVQMVLADAPRPLYPFKVDLGEAVHKLKAERDEARAELAQAREVLSRLEWDSWGYDHHAEGRSHCPCCGWTKDEGHAPDCALSAALAAKGE